MEVKTQTVVKGIGLTRVIAHFVDNDGYPIRGTEVGNVNIFPVNASGENISYEVLGRETLVKAYPNKEGTFFTEVELPPNKYQFKASYQGEVIEGTVNITVEEVEGGLLGDIKVSTTPTYKNDGLTKLTISFKSKDGGGIFVPKEKIKLINRDTNEPSFFNGSSLILNMDGDYEVSKVVPYGFSEVVSVEVDGQAGNFFAIVQNGHGVFENGDFTVSHKYIKIQNRVGQETLVELELFDTLGVPLTFDPSKISLVSQNGSSVNLSSVSFTKSTKSGSKFIVSLTSNDKINQEVFVSYDGKVSKDGFTINYVSDTNSIKTFNELETQITYEYVAGNRNKTDVIIKFFTDDGTPVFQSPSDVQLLVLSDKSAKRVIGSDYEFINVNNEPLTYKPIGYPYVKLNPEPGVVVFRIDLPETDIVDEIITYSVKVQEMYGINERVFSKYVHFLRDDYALSNIRPSSGELTFDLGDGEFVGNEFSVSLTFDPIDASKPIIPPNLKFSTLDKSISLHDVMGNKPSVYSEDTKNIGKNFSVNEETGVLTWKWFGTNSVPFYEMIQGKFIDSLVGFGEEIIITNTVTRPRPDLVGSTVSTNKPMTGLLLATPELPHVIDFTVKALDSEGKVFETNGGNIILALYKEDGSLGSLGKQNWKKGSDGQYRASVEVRDIGKGTIKVLLDGQAINTTIDYEMSLDTTEGVLDLSRSTIKTDRWTIAYREPFSVQVQYFDQLGRKFHSEHVPVAKVIGNDYQELETVASEYKGNGLWNLTVKADGGADGYLTLSEEMVQSSQDSRIYIHGEYDPKETKFDFVKFNPYVDAYELNTFYTVNLTVKDTNLKLVKGFSDLIKLKCLDPSGKEVEENSVEIDPVVKEIKPGIYQFIFQILKDGGYTFVFELIDVRLPPNIVVGVFKTSPPVWSPEKSELVITRLVEYGDVAVAASTDSLKIEFIARDFANKQIKVDAGDVVFHSVTPVEKFLFDSVENVDYFGTISKTVKLTDNSHVGTSGEVTVSYKGEPLGKSAKFLIVDRSTWVNDLNSGFKYVDNGSGTSSPDGTIDSFFQTGKDFKVQTFTDGYSWSSFPPPKIIAEWVDGRDDEIVFTQTPTSDKNNSYHTHVLNFTTPGVFKLYQEVNGLRIDNFLVVTIDEVADYYDPGSNISFPSPTRNVLEGTPYKVLVTLVDESNEPITGARDIVRLTDIFPHTFHVNKEPYKDVVPTETTPGTYEFSFDGKKVGDFWYSFAYRNVTSKKMTNVRVQKFGWMDGSFSTITKTPDLRRYTVGDKVTVTVNAKVNSTDPATNLAPVLRLSTAPNNSYPEDPNFSKHIPEETSPGVYVFKDVELDKDGDFNIWARTQNGVALNPVHIGVGEDKPYYYEIKFTDKDGNPIENNQFSSTDDIYYEVHVYDFEKKPYKGNLSGTSIKRPDGSNSLLSNTQPYHVDDENGVVKFKYEATGQALDENIVAMIDGEEIGKPLNDTDGFKIDVANVLNLDELAVNDCTFDIEGSGTTVLGGKFRLNINLYDKKGVGLIGLSRFLKIRFEPNIKEGTPKLPKKLSSFYNLTIKDVGLGRYIADGTINAGLDGVIHLDLEGMENFKSIPFKIAGIVVDDKYHREQSHSDHWLYMRMLYMYPDPEFRDFGEHGDGIIATNIVMTDLFGRPVNALEELLHPFASREELNGEFGKHRIRFDDNYQISLDAVENHFETVGPGHVKFFWKPIRKARPYNQAEHIDEEQLMFAEDWKHEGQVWMRPQMFTGDLFEIYLLISAYHCQWDSNVLPQFISRFPIIGEKSGDKLYDVYSPKDGKLTAYFEQYIDHGRPIGSSIDQPLNTFQNLYTVDGETYVEFNFPTSYLDDYDNVAPITGRPHLVGFGEPNEKRYEGGGSRLESNHLKLGAQWIGEKVSVPGEVKNGYLEIGYGLYKRVSGYEENTPVDLDILDTEVIEILDPQAPKIKPKHDPRVRLGEEQEAYDNRKASYQNWKNAGLFGDGKPRVRKLGSTKEGIHDTTSLDLMTSRITKVAGPTNPQVGDVVTFRLDAMWMADTPTDGFNPNILPWFTPFNETKPSPIYHLRTRYYPHGVYEFDVEIINNTRGVFRVIEDGEYVFFGVDLNSPVELEYSEEFSDIITIPNADGKFKVGSDGGFSVTLLNSGGDPITDAAGDLRILVYKVEEDGNDNGVEIRVATPFDNQSLREVSPGIYQITRKLETVGNYTARFMYEGKLSKAKAPYTVSEAGDGDFDDGVSLITKVPPYINRPLETTCVFQVTLWDTEGELMSGEAGGLRLTKVSADGSTVDKGTLGKYVSKETQLGVYTFRVPVTEALDGNVGFTTSAKDSKSWTPVIVRPKDWFNHDHSSAKKTILDSEVVKGTKVDILLTAELDPSYGATGIASYLRICEQGTIDAPISPDYDHYRPTETEKGKYLFKDVVLSKVGLNKLYIRSSSAVTKVPLEFTVTEVADGKFDPDQSSIKIGSQAPFFENGMNITFHCTVKDSDGKPMKGLSKYITLTSVNKAYEVLSSPFGEHMVAEQEDGVYYVTVRIPEGMNTSNISFMTSEAKLNSYVTLFLNKDRPEENYSIFGVELVDSDSLTQHADMIIGDSGKFKVILKDKNEQPIDVELPIVIESATGSSTLKMGEIVFVPKSKDGTEPAHYLADFVAEGVQHGVPYECTVSFSTTDIRLGSTPVVTVDEEVKGFDPDKSTIVLTKPKIRVDETMEVVVSYKGEDGVIITGLEAPKIIATNTSGVTQESEPVILSANENTPGVWTLTFKLVKGSVDLQFKLGDVTNTTPAKGHVYGEISHEKSPTTILTSNPEKIDVDSEINFQITLVDEFGVSVDDQVAIVQSYFVNEDDSEGTLPNDGEVIQPEETTPGVYEFKQPVTVAGTYNVTWKFGEEHGKFENSAKFTVIAKDEGFDQDLSTIEIDREKAFKDQMFAIEIYLRDKDGEVIKGDRPPSLSVTNAITGEVYSPDITAKPLYDFGWSLAVKLKPGMNEVKFESNGKISTKSVPAYVYLEMDDNASYTKIKNDNPNNIEPNTDLTIEVKLVDLDGHEVTGVTYDVSLAFSLDGSSSDHFDDALKIPTESEGGVYTFKVKADKEGNWGVGWKLFDEFGTHSPFRVFRPLEVDLNLSTISSTETYGHIGYDLPVVVQYKDRNGNPIDSSVYPTFVSCMDVGDPSESNPLTPVTSTVKTVNHNGEFNCILTPSQKGDVRIYFVYENGVRSKNYITIKVYGEIDVDKSPLMLVTPDVNNIPLNETVVTKVTLIDSDGNEIPFLSKHLRLVRSLDGETIIEDGTNQIVPTEDGEGNYEFNLPMPEEGTWKLTYVSKDTKGYWSEYTVKKEVIWSDDNSLFTSIPESLMDVTTEQEIKFRLELRDEKGELITEAESLLSLVEESGASFGNMETASFKEISTGVYEINIGASGTPVEGKFSYQYNEVKSTKQIGYKTLKPVQRPDAKVSKFVIWDNEGNKEISTTTTPVNVPFECRVYLKDSDGASLEKEYPINIHLVNSETGRDGTSFTLAGYMKDESEPYYKFTGLGLKEHDATDFQSIVDFDGEEIKIEQTVKIGIAPPEQEYMVDPDKSLVVFPDTVGDKQWVTEHEVVAGDTFDLWVIVRNHLDKDFETDEMTLEFIVNVENHGIEFGTPVFKNADEKGPIRYVVSAKSTKELEKVEIKTQITDKLGYKATTAQPATLVVKPIFDDKPDANTSTLVKLSEEGAWLDNHTTEVDEPFDIVAFAINKDGVNVTTEDLTVKVVVEGDDTGLTVSEGTFVAEVKDTPAHFKFTVTPSKPIVEGTDIFATFVKDKVFEVKTNKAFNVIVNKPIDTTPDIENAAIVRLNAGDTTKVYLGDKGEFVVSVRTVEDAPAVGLENLRIKFLDKKGGVVTNAFDKVVPEEKTPGIYTFASTYDVTGEFTVSPWLGEKTSTKSVTVNVVERLPEDWFNKDKSTIKVIPETGNIEVGTDGGFEVVLVGENDAPVEGMSDKLKLVTMELDKEHTQDGTFSTLVPEETSQGTYFFKTKFDKVLEEFVMFRTESTVSKDGVNVVIVDSRPKDWFDTTLSKIDVEPKGDNIDINSEGKFTVSLVGRDGKPLGGMKDVLRLTTVGVPLAPKKRARMMMAMAQTVKTDSKFADIVPVETTKGTYEFSTTFKEVVFENVTFRTSSTVATDSVPVNVVDNRPIDWFNRQKSSIRYEGVQPTQRGDTGQFIVSLRDDEGKPRTGLTEQVRIGIIKASKARSLLPNTQIDTDNEFGKVVPEEQVAGDYVFNVRFMKENTLDIGYKTSSTIGDNKINHVTVYEREEGWFNDELSEVKVLPVMEVHPLDDEITVEVRMFNDIDEPLTGLAKSIELFDKKNTPEISSAQATETSPGVYTFKFTIRSELDTQMSFKTLAGESDKWTSLKVKGGRATDWFDAKLSTIEITPVVDNNKRELNTNAVITVTLKDEKGVNIGGLGDSITLVLKGSSELSSFNGGKFKEGASGVYAKTVKLTKVVTEDITFKTTSVTSEQSAIMDVIDSRPSHWFDPENSTISKIPNDPVFDLNSTVSFLVQLRGWNKEPLAGLAKFLKILTTDHTVSTIPYKLHEMVPEEVSPGDYKITVTTTELVETEVTYQTSDGVKDASIIKGKDKVKFSVVDMKPEDWFDPELSSIVVIPKLPEYDLGTEVTFIATLMRYEDKPCVGIASQLRLFGATVDNDVTTGLEEIVPEEVSPGVYKFIGKLNVEMAAYVGAKTESGPVNGDHLIVVKNLLPTDWFDASKSTITVFPATKEIPLDTTGRFTVTLYDRYGEKAGGMAKSLSLYNTKGSSVFSKIVPTETALGVYEFNVTFDQEVVETVGFETKSVQSTATVPVKVVNTLPSDWFDNLKSKIEVTPNTPTINLDTKGNFTVTLVGRKDKPVTGLQDVLVLHDPTKPKSTFEKATAKETDPGVYVFNVNFDTITSEIVGFKTGSTKSQSFVEVTVVDGNPHEWFDKDMSTIDISPDGKVKVGDTRVVRVRLKDSKGRPRANVTTLKLVALGGGSIVSQQTSPTQSVPGEYLITISSNKVGLDNLSFETKEVKSNKFVEVSYYEERPDDWFDVVNSSISACPFDVVMVGDYAIITVRLMENDTTVLRKVKNLELYNLDGGELRFLPVKSKETAPGIYEFMVSPFEVGVERIAFRTKSTVSDKFVKLTYIEDTTAPSLGKVKAGWSVPAYGGVDSGAGGPADLLNKRDPTIPTLSAKELAKMKEVTGIKNSLIKSTK